MEVKSSLAKKVGEHLRASRSFAVLCWKFLEATSPSTSSSLSQEGSPGIASIREVCAHEIVGEIAEMSTGPLAKFLDAFGAFIGPGAPLDLGKDLKDVPFRAVVFMEAAVHLGQHLCCLHPTERVHQDTFAYADRFQYAFPR